MPAPGNQFNIDDETVSSFSEEWTHFDQSRFGGSEWQTAFDSYFSIFPFASLSGEAEGFDMGCGSGRWARGVAPRIGRLNCIDPAAGALAAAKRNLSGFANVAFHHASTETVLLAPESQDFGYSLGVLHHIPDTAAALAACTRLLKPGAPFLLYLYYRFDNRPTWFRTLWRVSELCRGSIARLPHRAKPVLTDTLAALVYWPLARSARLFERLGGNPGALPLSYYRDSSFYTMRTDSRDRFGTPLEQRFTRAEITLMMKHANLTDIHFSEREPFWVAVGRKKS
jgi:SAM-dependent methyltransferase